MFLLISTFRCHWDQSSVLRLLHLLSNNLIQAIGLARVLSLSPPELQVQRPVKYLLIILSFLAKWHFHVQAEL